MKPDIPFGELFATRTLTWRNDSSEECEAYVDISMPILIEGDDETHDCWSTQVRLRNTEDDQLQHAYGEDKIQSIYLAMVMAGNLLKRMPCAMQSEWAALPNFGFPSLPTIQNGLCTDLTLNG